jgi:predicted PhzF superfamily epimerase YddE/YHI9
MQDVAREMNLSETAFLHPRDGGYELRWFSPVTEIALCGHATLASAHVLWSEGHRPAGQQARFHTASGWLTADQCGEWIELDFPATPPVRAAAPPGLTAALGLPGEPRWVGRSQFDYLLEVASETAVRGLEPDFTSLEHCALTPFWSERLGKPELLAYQASPRGGVIRVRVDGNRVRLGGQTVLEGELVFDP